MTRLRIFSLIPILALLPTRVVAQTNVTPFYVLDRPSDGGIAFAPPGGVPRVAIASGRTVAIYDLSQIDKIGGKARLLASHSFRDTIYDVDWGSTYVAICGDDGLLGSIHGSTYSKIQDFKNTVWKDRDLLAIRFVDASRAFVGGKPVSANHMSFGRWTVTSKSVTSYSNSSAVSFLRDWERISDIDYDGKMWAVLCARQGSSGARWGVFNARTVRGRCNARASSQLDDLYGIAISRDGAVTTSGQVSANHSTCWHWTPSCSANSPIRGLSSGLWMDCESIDDHWSAIIGPALLLLYDEAIVQIGSGGGGTKLDSHQDGKRRWMASGSSKTAFYKVDGLRRDVPSISLSVGGRQKFSLTAGYGNANHSYLVMGSFSGTSPGLVYRGCTIPLAADSYLWISVALANSSLFVRTLGTLDSDGEAMAQLVLPAGLPPSLAGITAHHAYLVFESATLRPLFVSNPVSLKFVR